MAESQADFKKSMLDAHNKYRAHHGVPPVTWCNAFMAMPAREGAAAVESWYSEIKKYNFGSSHGSGTGHFTQVVWKTSTKMGAARSRNGIYIVANYSPAGNFMGENKANVLPPGGGPAPQVNSSQPSRSSQPSSRPGLSRSQTAAPASRSSQPSRSSKPAANVVKIKIPAGAKPGDSITVGSGSDKYTIKVPPGSKAGDHVTVTLPDKPTPQPAAPARSSSSTAKKETRVKVPAGSKPGDEIQVKSAGNTYTFKVPRGAKVGDSFVVELSDANKAPPKPAASSSSKTAKIKVPNGAKAGDRISVSLNGQKYEIQVPSGKRPGDTFTADLSKPPPPASKPSHSSQRPSSSSSRPSNQSSRSQVASPFDDMFEDRTKVAHRPSASSSNNRLSRSNTAAPSRRVVKTSTSKSTTTTNGRSVTKTTTTKTYSDGSTEVETVTR